MPGIDFLAPVNIGIIIAIVVGYFIVTRGRKR